MQNGPETELGLWDGNQEMHLQLLRHIRKTASRIITGEKNFSHPHQGGSGMQQEKTWVLIMAPICTIHEVLSKLGNCLILFITSNKEKVIVISTSDTILRIKGDNDYVKEPELKHL